MNVWKMEIVRYNGKWYIQGDCLDPAVVNTREEIYPLLEIAFEQVEYNDEHQGTKNA